MLPSQTNFLDFPSPFRHRHIEEDSGVPENVAGAFGGTFASEDPGLDVFLSLARQKRAHETTETWDPSEGPESGSTPSKRPRLSSPDQHFPLSFAELVPFTHGTPIKEEDIHPPFAAETTPNVADREDQQSLANTSPSPPLGTWVNNLSPADKQAALQFLQLPSQSLVEMMFQIKSRYEHKVRSIVNNLKDDVQFAKDTNTVILNQLVESNQRETSLSNMLTSTLSQLVEKEKSYRSVQDQLAELQRETDKPQMQWNERKDSIQINIGVPVSVLTVNWKMIFPATLDNLTLSILDKMLYIKKIWRQTLPQNEITKIEYVMNEDLYVQFKAAKAERRSSFTAPLPRISTGIVSLYHSVDMI